MAWAAAGVFALVAAALGQSSGTAPAEPSQAAFRRVFVPQDALPTQIRGLVPLKREPFERLLGEATAGRPLDQPPPAELLRMRLVARVDDQALRDGIAELELRGEGAQPALVVLEPWNLRLTSAVWKAPTLKPAVVGRDPAGRLCCLVPHSGRLELAFHQPALPTRDDQLQFELALPPAPQRDVQLVVPRGWSVAATGGLVRRALSADDGAGERWTVALAGENTLRLAVRRPGGAAGRPQVWREMSRYTLYRGTLDLEATWQWEAPKPLTSGLDVRFRLPKGLRVTAVRQGEQAAAWSLQPVASSGEHVLVVSLPAEAEAGTLTVTASGDWSPEGTFVLPRVVPHEGVYQEGQVELYCEPWLQVQPRVARGGMRVAVSTAAQTTLRGLDRFAMQLFEPEAEIEVAASPAFAPLSVNSATQLLVEASQVLAVATAEVAVLSGERFSLEAQVPRPWVVDAVEVQPPEMLAERSVTAQGTGPQRLRLQLARPLVAGRPLRVTLRAHFRRPPAGQPLAEGFLQPLAFPEARGLKRWIAVQVEDTAAELRLEDDVRLRRVEEKELTPAERQLFEQPPTGLLLTTSDPAATARATLEAATARYQAEVLLRVEVGRRQVQHTLFVKCAPQGAALGSVLVRLVPPPRDNVTWRLVDDARDLTALPEPAGNQQADQPAEVWRVPLPRPRNSPFELTAQWTSPLAATHDVPLVGLPDATLTTALVEVHARDGHLTMQTRQMQPLPPLPPEPGRSSTLCGRFRYAAGQQPQLVLARTAPQPGDLRAWVESLQLTSRWTLDGRGEHEAQLVVHSAGREELRLALPRDVEDPSWQLVSSDAASSGTASDHSPTHAALSGSGELVIPLPPLEARATVVLRYRTTHRGLARWPWRTWQVPLPSLDLPVLRRGWTISLPSELSIWSPPTAEGNPRAVVGLQPANTQAALARVPPPGGAAAAAGAAPRLLDGLWAVVAGPGWLAEACKALVAPPGAPPDPAFAGWQQFTLRLPDGPQAAVSVYRVSWAAAWAWVWACAAAAWGWRRRGRFSTTSGIAFLALSLALLSNTPHRWWLAGAGFGALAGGVFAVAWPRSRPRGQAPAERPSGVLSQEKRELPQKRLQPAAPSVGLWLMWTVGLSLGMGLSGPGSWLGTLAAQEEPARASPRARVVIPVDDEGQPAGDYVYLDPGLYELLHRRVDRRPGEPLWLVVKARYELSEPSAAGEAGGEGTLLAVPRLRAQWDLETFQPHVRVVLPLRQDEVTLHPGESRLDGQPATLAWEPDGQGLAVVISEPGRHQLEMVFATRARRVGNVVQLELSVPPAAIEEWGDGLDGAQGNVTIGPPAQERRGRVAFSSLGPGRVRWQWPADPPQAAAAWLEAEQLLWWKIRRGSVSLEARFQVRGLRPGPHTLSIEVDPRLRLVSGLSQGPIRRVHLDPAAPRLVQVDCEVPASGELAWQMAWLWPPASGVGRLLLPRVRLNQPRLTRDWTAVSVEPPLEWVRPTATSKPPSAEEPAAAGQGVSARSAGAGLRSDVGSEGPLGVPTPAAFLAAWGEQETPPLAVFATAAPELDAPLAIRPALPSPSADLEMDWSVGAAAAKLLLRARLQGTLGRFDYRLTWPVPLRVQRVALYQGGRAVAIRWTQPADGTLLVTLLEPPASDAELQVEGTLALPAARTRFALPPVRLDDVRAQEMRVRLYRQQEVLLDLPAAAGWEGVAEGPVGSFRHERGWLVGVLRRVDERARPLQVERKSHRPKLSGHLFVRVQPQADGWQAQTLIDLEVQDGFLDELRLSVPAAFSNQLRWDPAWETRWEPSAVASRRLWIVRPPVSVTGKVQVSLQGRLDPAAGGIVVPDVSLPDAPQVARWVRLEPGAPDEPIDWQPRGLVAVRPQEVPAAASAWGTEQGQWFRVVGRRFEATGRLRQQKDASPRCLLAAYTVAPVAPRRLVTLATFTLVPADTRPLVLALPPGQRLVQVLVDGVAATPTAIGPRRWQVAAPSDVLPYQLTVLADGQEPTLGTEGRWAWPLPELVDLPAARWLITVRGPWAAQTPGIAPRQLVVEAAQPCSADEAALVQVEALARCLEEVTAAQTRDLPGGIVSQALGRWLMPLEQALAALAPAGRSEESASWQARLESVQQLVAAIKTRSGLAEAAFKGMAPPQQAPSAGVLTSLASGLFDPSGLALEGAGDPAAPTVHLWAQDPPAQAPVLVLLGAADRSITSALRPRDEQDVLTALLLGAALVALGVGLWPRAAGWLARHQPLALMLASAAWWLTAPWGWLGWLGCLVAGWRAWRERAVGGRPEPLSAGSRSTSHLPRGTG